MKRLLLLAPVVERGFVGGLQFALMDLRRELERLGWEVEAPLRRDEEAALEASVRPAAPRVARLQRHPALLRLRARVPAGARLTASSLVDGRGEADAAARNLAWAEERLRAAERYDAVLVCLDTNVRGMLALALARHPRVTVLSLAALAEELQPVGWGLVRRLRARHPFHYLPAKAARIRCAIFASERWREDAVRAGLPAEVAHTVYFGIPVGPRPVRERAGRRLLWVGRLAPEKGLHLLLAAMPRLRERLPGVTLTAVAAQGEGTYRELIGRLVARAGLGDVVTLHPPVAREELPAIYAAHDALFFHSINPEPVALVLLEAYANGLPVVANRASTDLVEDGVTCATYDPGDEASIARAFERLLTDGALRAGLADRARARVEARYSRAAMGAAYDRLLRAPRPEAPSR